jgi:hypothetical protein
MDISENVVGIVAFARLILSLQTKGKGRSSSEQPGYTCLGCWLISLLHCWR